MCLLQSVEVRLLYLGVALVWLLLALVLFIFPEWMPIALRRIPNTDLSMGWVCVFFFAWRMYGWWQWRRRTRPRAEDHTSDEEPCAPAAEYNPEFDFTKDEPERR